MVGSLLWLLQWPIRAAILLLISRLPLGVDVVEELELIEVHQANPSLAEDVDLLIQEELTPPLLSPVELGPEEDGDLRTGLLLVVVG
ncbi:MAG: hypothetical protein ACKOPT_03990 [Cyanobium sp.]